MGDMRAQLASIRTGERRLAAFAQALRQSAFKDSIRLVFEQSEKLARAAVRRIPDGVYEAESFMDDDGVKIGKQIPIKVRVEVRGDKMTIDLSGVSPQVAGFYNSGLTAGRSAAEVVFKCITTPLLLPINDGSFRPLKIILPPGRVISAMKPAPVRVWMTVPMTVCDTIFKALAPACPERTIAGALRRPVHRQPSRLRPRDRTIFLVAYRPSRRRLGREVGQDGMSATVCLNDGDTHNSPIEATEAKSPIIVEQRSLRKDSAGPGKFRGGLGVAQEVRMRKPATILAHWSAPFARRGACTAAKPRWRTASRFCVTMAGWRDSPRGKSSRPSSMPATVFSSRPPGAADFGIRWNVPPKRFSPTCARVT